MALQKANADESGAWRCSGRRSSADEIRAMLAKRRIRGAKRIALAEKMISQREASETGARGNGQTDRAAAEPEELRAAEARAEAAAEEAQADTAKAAGAGAQRAAAVPMARQIGGYLGIGMGIAGLAALALMVVRR